MGGGACKRSIAPPVATPSSPAHPMVSVLRCVPAIGPADSDKRPLFKYKMRNVRGAIACQPQFSRPEPNRKGAPSLFTHSHHTLYFSPPCFVVRQKRREEESACFERPLRERERGKEREGPSRVFSRHFHNLRAFCALLLLRVI